MNRTKQQKTRQENVKKQLQIIEKEWVKQYQKGFRPSEIMKHLSETFHLSSSTLYKKLNIKQLKRIATHD